MVSLNNEVYVTGTLIHMLLIKVRGKEAEVLSSLQDLFERATFAGISQTAPAAPDRRLARFKYKHLVNYRDLEVHHKGGPVGNSGSHAATSDQSHVCNAQWGDLCYRR